MTTLTDPMMRPPEAEIPKALYRVLLILLIVVLAFIVTAGCAQAQVPPALQTLSDDWEADLPPRVTYTTPEGDTALVLSDSMKYIRADFQDTTYAACPDLGAALFSMEDLAQTADSVMHGLAPYDKGSLWVTRSECITTFAERNALLP